jgi:NAD(P)-dependent dehydrogenase (short-subunit alcohol dehydrogenase family)
MSEMNDTVALITGASSGIDRATAEAFVARGAKVARHLTGGSAKLPRSPLVGN